jgi:hypothetical protein
MGASAFLPLFAGGFAMFGAMSLWSKEEYGFYEPAESVGSSPIRLNKSLVEI